MLCTLGLDCDPVLVAHSGLTFGTSSITARHFEIIENNILASLLYLSGSGGVFEP